MCSPLELIGNKQSGVILVKETERAPFKCNAQGNISRAGRTPRASLQRFGEPGRVVCIFSDSRGRLGAWLEYTSAENRAFCHLPVSASRGLNQKRPQTQVPPSPLPPRPSGQSGHPLPAPRCRSSAAPRCADAINCIVLETGKIIGAKPLQTTSTFPCGLQGAGGAGKPGCRVPRVHLLSNTHY